MSETWVKGSPDDELAIVIEFKDQKKPSYYLRANTVQETKDWITVLHEGLTFVDFEKIISVLLHTILLTFVDFKNFERQMLIYTIFTF